MCDPTGGVLTAALLGGTTALQVYQGEKARKAQSKAAADAATAADQAMNKANPKKPDAGAMLDGNRMAASGGAGSTMLTGALGIDPAQLTLGKTTLLGGS